MIEGLYMSEYAIQVDHVSMCFNLAKEKVDNLKEMFIKKLHGNLSFDEFYAIKDASFKVKKGESFAIVGSNGSGKSTMLKIISGILKPTKGNVTVEGTIAPMIELGTGFDMDLTARENIFLNGSVLGHSREFMQEHFDEIVEFSELESFIDVPVKNFSSGMVARLGFAIMTIVKPDILIVDEILSVGDQYFKQKSEQRMRELMAGGTTIILVSHSMEQVQKICDRAIWLEKGNIRCSGDVDEVYGQYLGEMYRKRKKESKTTGDKKNFQQARILMDEETDDSLAIHDSIGKKGEIVLADLKEEVGDYRNRLYSPTHFTKLLCGDQYYYFIVDSFHHRVLYCEDMNRPIKDWNVLADDIATPIMAEGDGDVILVTESGYNRIRVYRYVCPGIFNYSQCIQGITGARNVIYDNSMKRFLTVDTRGNNICEIKNDDGHVAIRRRFSIDAIKNDYIRAIRIVEDMLFVLSNTGKIYTLNHIDDSFEVLAQYDVHEIISDLYDITRDGLYYYLTSGQKRCIRFGSLEELEKGKYEDITSMLKVKGSPANMTVINHRIYITEMHESSQIISFLAKNNRIEEVNTIMDFGTPKKEDIIRLCKYPS